MPQVVGRVARLPQLLQSFARLRQLPLIRLVGQSARAAAILYASIKDANTVVGWTLKKAGSAVTRAVDAADTCMQLFYAERKMFFAKLRRELVTKLKLMVSDSASVVVGRACALGASVVDLSRVFCFKRTVRPDNHDAVQVEVVPLGNIPEPEPLECAECQTRAEILKYRQKLKRERTQNF